MYAGLLPRSRSKGPALGEVFLHKKIIPDVGLKRKIHGN
jgi:hypothetical protein